MREYDLNPSTGYLQSWNFTIERALFGDTSIEIDYRGSMGTHVIRRYDFNQSFRTADSFIAGEGFVLPIPEWNALQIFGTGANSNYNASNASWRKRSRGACSGESTIRSRKRLTMRLKRMASRREAFRKRSIRGTCGGTAAARIGTGGTYSRWWGTTGRRSEKAGIGARMGGAQTPCSEGGGCPAPLRRIPAQP